MVSLRTVQHAPELNLTLCPPPWIVSVLSPSLTLAGCKVDMFDLKVEAVNTHRDRPLVSPGHFVMLCCVLAVHEALTYSRCELWISASLEKGQFNHSGPAECDWTKPICPGLFLKISNAHTDVPEVRHPVSFQLSKTFPAFAPVAD